ncbi:class I SAM-dependent methyltransferase [Paractinoplanes atraurantiacus]|uniref:Methyltransferase domain-containing protein n=1 Tax=Paractinoplanes atraurantiacus TaxID=1036182 RepID=A0A285IAQ0_9ACTN|nr:class I SAM-dependent methyltransferase [Actinoplanes atraurantiacus]SNY45074.1 Methyltransferase domain-containing protein [Actinoplanes atraurantiacus]
MPLISYNATDAHAFAETRHLTGDALAAWRTAISHHVHPQTRLLDLGAGTGSWTQAFQTWWPQAQITAVEPSPAMRDHALVPTLAGHAADIPLPADSVDAVWLSTVIHHIPDLPAAAREIHRVLTPGGVVLIRTVFPGRHHDITLFRYFPEAAAALERYPSVTDVQDAFADFTTIALQPVPQKTADSLTDIAQTLRREAHTPLQLITDQAYADGLARLHKAARDSTTPVIDSLDLLVLRR